MLFATLRIGRVWKTASSKVLKHAGTFIVQLLFFFPLIHWLRLMLGKPVEETPKEG